MSRPIAVHFLPQLMNSADLHGGTAVMIDVLRASTTIVHALGQGADAVIPCLEPEEARQRSALDSHVKILLGGERGGEIIPGFELDNSPRNYTREIIQGARIYFTTTNGTRALLESTAAARIVVGCFSNLHALMNTLVDFSADVHLVCAGTNGKVTSEDVLFAGAVVTGLQERSSSNQLTDSARIARDFFRQNQKSSATFDLALRNSIGGRNLQRLGMERDIERAGEWDRFAIVPEFHPDTGELTAPEPDGVGEYWLAAPPE